MGVVTASRKHSVGALPVADLDLVIPALNEEARIGATVDELHRVATDASLAVRFIVVDNGCVDSTADVVDRSAAADIPVELISCQTRGKGAAIRAGVRSSTAAFVGYCDADQSTPPGALLEGLDLLAAGWEVVLGYRKCAGADYVVRQPPLRRAGSFAFHAMATRLTGPVSDTQCGFKLFHAEAARSLFEATSLDGFAFDVELLARVRRAGLQAIELPVKWTHSDGSTFRPFADGLRSFQELLAVHRSLRAIPAAGA